MSEYKLTPLPCLSDNYTWVLSCQKTKTAVVVDPPETEPVVEYLKQHSLVLKMILITHHHNDHTAGVESLREVTGARVVGPQDERSRLPRLDQELVEGDVVTALGCNFEVLSTPGHTRGHISYYSKQGWLFCGDVLFSLGCGRCFECSPEVLWGSLEKLLDLPGATQVCCAHEYTLSNARFALSLEPENPALHARVEEVQRKKISLPVLLEAEKRLNPFLKVRDAEYRKFLGLEKMSAAEAFSELRERKDSFS